MIPFDQVVRNVNVAAITLTSSSTRSWLALDRRPNHFQNWWRGERDSTFSLAQPIDLDYR